MTPIDIHIDHSGRKYRVSVFNVDTKDMIYQETFIDVVDMLCSVEKLGDVIENTYFITARGFRQILKDIMGVGRESAVADVLLSRVPCSN